MNLEILIERARLIGASDVHVEAGLPPAWRVRGELRNEGEVLRGDATEALARELIPNDAWGAFRERGSADLARTMCDVRCRFNVLHSSRGIGLAIRLLSDVQPTLENLNLHPDIGRLVEDRHGLIVVCGPTGCGKSSTLAAMIHEINTSSPAHVLTLESPIEYVIPPRRAFIRQREVGRDTPTFDQGLLDALREDPDVIMVGEMRKPETMRLTLNSAETGHLVLTTAHSTTVGEALQRIILAFPAEIQPSIAAQLADCLKAVICQTLVWREDVKLRVPECEILIANDPVRSLLRRNNLYKLPQTLETGGRDGLWSRQRYRTWLGSRESFHERPTREPFETKDVAKDVAGPVVEIVSAPADPDPDPVSPAPPASTSADDDQVIIVPEPSESMRDILDELGKD